MMNIIGVTSRSGDHRKKRVRKNEWKEGKNFFRPST